MNSLTVALVGMFVVFSALVIIIVGILIYSRMVRGKGTKNNTTHHKPSSGDNTTEVPETISHASVSQESPDTELVAVITAAIMAGMQHSSTGFVVKSIKRIHPTTPVWNVAGRNEYILSKL